MQIKCVIFDMDGVIVDTEPMHMEDTRSFFEQIGVIIPDSVNNMVCGLGVEDAFDIIKANVSGIDMDVDEYMRLRSLVKKPEDRDIRPYADKDIYPLMEWLRDNDIRIALASAAPDDKISDYLTQLDIMNFFEIVVSAYRFERSKPDPEVYDYTIGKLGVSPKECLIIEDSTIGIEAGKASGAFVAAKRDERFGYDQTKADFLIDSLMQVKDIIGL